MQSANTLQEAIQFFTDYDNCREFMIAVRWADGIPTMKDAEGRKFYHRVNDDGTIDSICRSCFLTVARADIGSDLQGLEAAHRCKNKEPFILSEDLQSLRLR